MIELNGECLQVGKRMNNKMNKVMLKNYVEIKVIQMEALETVMNVCLGQMIQTHSLFEQEKRRMRLDWSALRKLGN